jgi:hypothetical protein
MVAVGLVCTLNPEAVAVIVKAVCVILGEAGA